LEKECEGRETVDTQRSLEEIHEELKKISKLLSKTIRDKKLMPMFQPQDDKENVESLNAGYMAETAPYGYYRTNKK